MSIYFIKTKASPGPRMKLAQPPTSCQPTLAQTYTLPLGLGVPPWGASHHLAGRRQAPSTALTLAEDVGEALKTDKGWSVRTAGSKDAGVLVPTEGVQSSGACRGQPDQTSSSLRSSSPTIILSGQEASPTESLRVSHHPPRYNPALRKHPLQTRNQSLLFSC